MNEEIRSISNEKKTTKNEQENDDSDFLPVLYIVYKSSEALLYNGILSTIKIKCGQILVSSLLETGTSTGSFYGLIKMTTQRDL